MEAIGIDLGSNTLRAVLINHDDEILWEYETVVRTAQGLHKDSQITAETLQRLIVAIEEMKRDFKAHIQKDFLEFPYLALATAALRKARNQEHIVNTLAKEQGISFQVIPASAEALFTLNATLFALKRHKQPNKPFFLVDIGGASIEVSFYHHLDYIYLDPFLKPSADIFKSRSFDMGIVTLSESPSQNSKAMILALRDSIKQELQAWKQPYSSDPLLIVSGGVPNTIIALKQGLTYQQFLQTKQSIGTLTLDDVRLQKDFYHHLSQEERIRFVGKKRADLIEVGISLYESFFEAFEMTESMTVSESLREGAALYIKQKSR